MEKFLTALVIAIAGIAAVVYISIQIGEYQDEIAIEPSRTLSFIEKKCLNARLGLSEGLIPLDIAMKDIEKYCGNVSQKQK